MMVALFRYSGRGYDKSTTSPSCFLEPGLSLPVAFGSEGGKALVEGAVALRSESGEMLAEGAVGNRGVIKGGRGERIVTGDPYVGLRKRRSSTRWRKSTI